MTSEPLILTIKMDRGSFAHLDGLRRCHFPPDQNMVPAHITLFHKLPGQELRRINDHLGETCGRLSSFVIATTGVRFSVAA